MVGLREQQEVESTSDELHEYPFVFIIAMMIIICVRESTAMLIMNWNVNESNFHIFFLNSVERSLSEEYNYPKKNIDLPNSQNQKTW